MNLPPISAKSLRIPAITSSSEGSGSDGLGGAESGGGARNEATPQNWRLRVLVSSERSPLTPPGAEGVGGSDDGESDCGRLEFGSAALALGFWLVLGFS